MSRKVECTGHIEVTPDFFANGTRVRSISATKVTQNRPRATREGSVIVKVRFVLPEEAFLPLAPSAVIEVPLEMLDREVKVVVE